MAKVEDIIQRGTRAGQPTPTTGEQVGILYYVSDESVTERWSGSAWEDISDTGGGGGGGLTHSYLGYNTVGGTQEVFGALGAVPLTLFKKVTIPGGGGVITSIGAYIQMISQNTAVVAAGVYEDSGGAPDHMLSNSMLFGGGGAGGAIAIGTGQARWLHLPVGLFVPAGDVWIAFTCVTNNASNLEIAYDGSGSDQYHTVGFGGLADGSSYSLTVGSRKYSIRADFIA